MFLLTPTHYFLLMFSRFLHEPDKILQPTKLEAAKNITSFHSAVNALMHNLHQIHAYQVVQSADCK